MFEDIITVREMESGWLVNSEFYVPNAEGNRHTALVLQWMTDGGEVIPYEPPPEIPQRRTTEQILLDVVNIFVAKEELEDEDILKLADVFPDWEPGITAKKDRVYRYDERLWQVTTEHVTQADWPPPDVPALFREIAPLGTIPIWTQPYGAGNAYQVGDRVQWPEGTIWRSTVPDNVWEPGVYGWALD